MMGSFFLTATVLAALTAKNYHRMAYFCKVIVPIRRVQFFMPHSVELLLLCLMTDSNLLSMDIINICSGG